MQALLNNTLPVHTDALDSLLQALLAFTNSNSNSSSNTSNSSGINSTSTFMISKEIVWQAFKDIVSKSPYTIGYKYMYTIFT